MKKWVPLTTIKMGALKRGGGQLKSPHRNDTSGLKIGTLLRKLQGKIAFTCASPDLSSERPPILSTECPFPCLPLCSFT